MPVHNRRDFRVETSVNLLKRWGFLSEAKDNEFNILQPLDSSGVEHDLLNVAKNTQRIRQDNSRLMEMVDYATTDVCRVQKIHEYFGDATGPCGLCDVCCKSKK